MAPRTKKPDQRAVVSSEAPSRLRSQFEKAHRAFEIVEVGITRTVGEIESDLKDAYGVPMSVVSGSRRIYRELQEVDAGELRKQRKEQ